MNTETVFQIKDDVRAKYPELVELTIATESMDDNEKQYWFDILPSMTDEQVLRLTEILKNEKEKLAEIEKTYKEELKILNEAHLIEWNEYRKRRLEDGAGILKELTA